jgi:hypothetical protein
LESGATAESNSILILSLLATITVYMKQFSPTDRPTSNTQEYELIICAICLTVHEKENSDTEMVAVHVLTLELKFIHSQVLIVQDGPLASLFGVS